MRQIERQGPVVLIVDDERIIADTLSMILSRSGFAVLTAYDGQSALELARIIPPELLLTDVMMAPGMNGVELATAVAETVPDCKILLFSGQAATVDLLADARDTGHNFTLLTKPLHPTELLARIAAALEVRESIAAP
jgi:DNA-binding response OmpR family regulator